MTPKQPTIQSRIVGNGEADPAALVANPRNWRSHPPEQRAALEIEPRYVQVAIERWQAFTGQDATRG